MHAVNPGRLCRLRSSCKMVEVGGSEAEQLYQLVELGDVVTQGSGPWSRSVTVLLINHA